MNDYTVGVEEEYQLIDGCTAELRSSAQAVLECDWSGDIRREIQESTIEIGTRVCDSAGAVRAELKRLRTQAAAAASALDLDIVAAGVHPFSHWRGHRMAGGERYARMAEMYGRIARDEHNFGMHIHVAAHGDRMSLIGSVRRYIPHLLALSCSSPYYEGDDTGYASYRMVLWRRWPGAGLPPRLESDAQYRRYVDGLLHARVLDDERSLYWVVRPHSVYPTLEFRMFDACPRLEHAVAIAGLTRVLVAAAADGMVSPHAHDWSADMQDAALDGDCWRAARYGLDARLVNPELETGFETARDALRRLSDELQPAADALGETAVLETLDDILDAGNGADRLRAFQRECNDLVLATRWLAAETLVGAGMDRRAEVRSEALCT